MKNKLIQQPLCVSRSPVDGYGVFAGKNFTLKEVIEECVVLVTNNQDPSFVNYYFRAGKASGIATGYGCLYNHSAEPNAEYVYDEKRQLLVISALRPIALGEEIFISYGDAWFSERNLLPKRLSTWRKFWRFFLGAPVRFLVLTGLVFLLIKMLKDNLPVFAQWYWH